MTLASEISKQSFDGDGVQTVFDFGFKFLESAQIEAILRDAAGLETVWELGTQYTLTGAGHESGGQLTVATSPVNHTPASGETLVIRRVVPRTQETDYPEGGKFPAAAHEDALDKLTMIAQELAEAIGRALTFPVTDPAISVGNLPADVDRASKFLAFDADGKPLASAGPAGSESVPASPFMATVLDDADAETARATLGISGATGRNCLVNGDFQVWQQGASITAATTPANDDDTYTADQWILLSDGDGIAEAARETAEVPDDGGGTALALEVATGAKKFGVLQILENFESAKLAGRNVSLSFKARVSAGAMIGALRAGILAWTGTADTVTSDVVAAWNAAGADPDPAPDWTFENAPAGLALSETWQEFAVEDIALDTSGLTNLAVFVWIDDTDATVGDIVYLTDVQLERGKKSTPYIRRSYNAELSDCERYFFKDSANGVSRPFSIGLATATTTFRTVYSYPHRMRIQPSLQISPDASSFWVRYGADQLATLSTISIGNSDLEQCRVDATIGSAVLTVGQAVILESQFTGCSLSFDARL